MLLTDQTERPDELVQTVLKREQPCDAQRRWFAENRNGERRFHLGLRRWGAGHSVGSSQTFGISVSVHLRVTGIPDENHGLQAARIHQVRRSCLGTHSRV